MYTLGRLVIGAAVWLLASGCSSASSGELQPSESPVTSEVVRTDPSKSVSDSGVVVLVPPEGGVAELPGYGRVMLAAGSFEAAESVTVAVTNAPSTPQWLRHYGWITEGD